jgi:hypothetical protein
MRPGTALVWACTGVRREATARSGDNTDASSRRRHDKTEVRGEDEGSIFIVMGKERNSSWREKVGSFFSKDRRGVTSIRLKICRLETRGRMKGLHGQVKKVIIVAMIIY